MGTGVLLTQAPAFVKIHQIVGFKSLQLAVCTLDFDNRKWEFIHKELGHCLRPQVVTEAICRGEQGNSWGRWRHSAWGRGCC